MGAREPARDRRRRCLKYGLGGARKTSEPRLRSIMRIAFDDGFRQRVHERMESFERREIVDHDLVRAAVAVTLVATKTAMLLSFSPGDPRPSGATRDSGHCRADARMKARASPKPHFERSKKRSDSSSIVMLSSDTWTISRRARDSSSPRSSFGARINPSSRPTPSRFTRRTSCRSKCSMLPASPASPKDRRAIVL